MKFRSFLSLALAFGFCIDPGAGFAQDNAPPVTVPKIGDISGCPNDNCDIVIGDKEHRYPEVHVLSKAQMPPPPLRKPYYFTTIEAALRHIQDGGTVFIHAGEYAEKLILTSPRSIQIEAYGDDKVTLKPSEECLLYRPYFQEDKSDPKITLKKLVFRPQQLGADKACITVLSNDIVLDDITIHMPSSEGATAILVRQGNLTLTHSKLYGDPGAAAAAGIVIDATSSAVIDNSTVNRFSVGIDVAGALTVENDSSVISNGTGILVSTEELHDPNKNTIEIRDSDIQTEDVRSVTAADDADATAGTDEIKNYGVEFNYRFASTALLENVWFNGVGQQSAGVVVSGGSVGKVHVKSSTFDGLAVAASVEGSITLEDNTFGDYTLRPETNSNKIAIDLRSNYYDTQYEMLSNSFLYNDISFQISSDFNGALTVSGSKGKIRSRGKHKYNLVESHVTKETILMACNIDRSSDIEKALLETANLGRIEACQKYMRQQH